MDKTLDRDFVIWAAGLIDGEGCLMIGKLNQRDGAKNPSYSAILQVGMTHGPTIQRLADGFGVGSVFYVKSNHERHKDHYRWVCVCDHAISVIKTVGPFVYTKADQVSVLLEFAALPKILHRRLGVPQGLLEQREKYFLALKDLKRK